jgi:hypothetical protein
MADQGRFSVRAQAGRMAVGGQERMILRRLTDNLRLQNWTTIAIELAIVIVGVFVGNQVSNWNQARLEKEQTARMLEQLGPELSGETDYFRSVGRYYDVTGRYADVALAGWNGDRRITDPQFVIAAYQASQVYGVGINGETWTLVFGGDQLRNIDDQKLRRHLGDVLTTDYTNVGLATMQTAYRNDVRLVIPNDIQSEIRARCGDRLVEDSADQNIFVLPAECPLALDPAKVSAAAKALRMHPSLAGELALHLGSVNAYLQNMEIIEVKIEKLEKDLERRQS